MIIDIELERIEDNPWQPRQEYHEIDALAADIQRNGLLQPLGGRCITRSGSIWRPAMNVSVLPRDSRIQLTFGHRRLRALYKNEALTAPVDVRYYDDQRMALIARSENAARVDISPIEDAQHIQRMLDEFHWTQAQAAEQLGMSRSSLANRLRLLNLPDEMRRRVAGGELSERQALAALPVLTLPEAALAQPSWKLNNFHEALSNGESSSALREKAEETVLALTLPITADDFPLDRLVVYDHDCNECPNLVKYKGEQRCADRECFLSKYAAYADYLVADAARHLHLPTIDYETAADECFYAHWHEFVKGEEDELQEALHHGGGPCVNLHLAPRRWQHMRASLTPEQHPRVCYVCIKHGKCQCRQDIADGKNLDAVQRENERKRQMAIVKNQFAQQLATALLAGKAWDMLWDYERITGPDRAAKAKKLAERILGRPTNDRGGRPEDPDMAREYFDQWLGDQVDGYNAQRTPLESARAQWERIQRWLGRLHQECPHREAMYGIQTQIQRIQKYIDSREALAQELTLAHEFINQLRSDAWPFILSQSGADFDAVTEIMTADSEDLNTALAMANKAALTYALHLCQYREDRARAYAIGRALQNVGAPTTEED